MVRFGAVQPCSWCPSPSKSWGRCFESLLRHQLKYQDNLPFEARASSARFAFSRQRESTWRCANLLRGGVGGHSLLFLLCLIGQNHFEITLVPTLRVASVGRRCEPPSGENPGISKGDVMHPRTRGTRQQLLDFLRDEHDFPIGKSTLDKECAPAVGKGPPVAAWWGRRPIYDFDEALAWAQARLRSTRQNRVPDGTNAERTMDGTPRSLTPAIEQKLVEAGQPVTTMMSAPDEPGTTT
jgi:hypothetical protein